VSYQNTRQAAARLYSSETALPVLNKKLHLKGNPIKRIQIEAILH
jgi:hypothetical protein